MTLPQTQYVIGIDLGTTNSALAYVDTKSGGPRAVKLLQITQFTQNGFVQPKPTLPSFCYQELEDEVSADSAKLPWPSSKGYHVGEFAKEIGSITPTRLVSSAKSWLCNASADRRARILPPTADEDLRISPVEATRRYLTHLRDAWNHIMAKDDPDRELQQQEVVLTVPASFDEVARTLTAEAAKDAGFLRVTLLEEPQAAFYSWIRDHESAWEESLAPGDTVLVCDVGGGTTDFSLIRVSEVKGERGFERIHVGEHLLLGGDNIDALIAHKLKERLTESGYHELASSQWMQLVHAARAAKEVLLGADEKSTYRVSLQGSGSKVVGGSISVDLSADDVRTWLLNGFFGSYDREGALILQPKSGLKGVGLPFESEPSITKHIAHFLFGQGIELARPSHILFNGGTMKPVAFQEAIVNTVARWYPEFGPLKVLPSRSLDLSVAYGAAYYGLTRRGAGVRIRSGLPRTYYLQIETDDGSKALTLLPKGTEEGSSFSPKHTFTALANTPVAFVLLSSQARFEDEQGQLISIHEEEMQTLSPLHTVLKFGRASQEHNPLPVCIEASLTPLGTIQLWVIAPDTGHKWELHFQVRKASGEHDSLAALADVREDEAFDVAALEDTKVLVRDALRPSSTIPRGKLMERLEETVGKKRKQWSLSLLRNLADVAIDNADSRKNSQDLERRWWNLVGFCMRPGAGAPLDDFRMQAVWKLILAWPREDASDEVLLQKWIFVRRISAGLNKGQQTQIANQLLAHLAAPQDNKRKKGKGKGADTYKQTELVRSLASLEYLGLKLKRRIADYILQRIRSGVATQHDLWAMGHLGSRQLLYASTADVVPADICSQWIEVLLRDGKMSSQWLAMPLVQMAQHTSYHELNISNSMFDKVLNALSSHPDGDRLCRLAKEGTDIDSHNQEALFGESLPIGLHLELSKN